MNQGGVDIFMSGHNSTLEVSDESCSQLLLIGLKCTVDIKEICDYNFYAIADHTPVNTNHNLDLIPLYIAHTIACIII